MMEWLLRLDLWGFRVVTTLLSVLWQSSIVITAAGILSYLLRKRSASVRHALWAVSVLTVPLIPFLGWIAGELGTPPTAIPVIPASEHRIPPDFAGLSLRDFEGEAPSGGTSPENGVPVESSSYQTTRGDRPFLPVSPWAVLLVAYCSGVGVFSLFFLYGRLRITRMISRGRTVLDAAVLWVFADARTRLGLRRRVRVVESGVLDVPLAAGVLRPVVFLPNRLAETFSTAEVRALALHELSHIRRWDPFVLTLVSLVRTFFFFHPLLWIAVHQMAKYAEVACDDAVVAHSGEPVGYARMLARVAERIMLRNARVQLAAGFLFSRSTLFTRVEAILSNRRENRTLSRPVLFLTAMAGFGAVLLALSFPLISRDRGEPITVTGVATSGNGPVHGAVVYLVTLDRESNQFRVDETARTNARGVFRFRTIDRNAGIEWIRSMILVRHPDYAMGWTQLGDARESRDRVVYLGRPGTVAGVVRDRSGRPVKGARVGIWDITPRDMPNMRSGSICLAGALEHSQVLTDSRGRFRLGNIPEISSVSIVVEREGYARDYHRVLPADGTNVACVLAPGGRIEGKAVYAASGDPAPGVTIIARAVGFMEKKGDRTVTGKDGKYIMDGLPEGQYHVFIAPSETWTAKIRQYIAVRPGETVSGIDLSLGRGGFVTGRVIDCRTGLPVSGFPVIVSEAISVPDMNDFRFIRTGRDGRYGFRAAPGDVEVRLAEKLPDGYRVVGDRVRTIAVEECAVMSGIDFSLEKGVEISGIVRMPDGRPVPGARVTVDENSSITEFSDRDGRFAISGLAVGDSLTLRAAGEDSLIHGKTRIVVSPGARVTVTAKRESAVTVSGRVVDAHGKPVSGAGIMLLYWEKGAKTGISTQAATSGPDGRFAIGNLREGEPYDVFLTEAYPNNDMFTARHGLPPITLVQPKADGWLEGTLVDADGAPVPGAMVYVSKPETGVRLTTTDHLGRYRLEKIMGERADLIINSPRHGNYRHLKLELNRRYDFRLVLANRSLSGVVVDGKGMPIPEAWILPEECGPVSDGFSLYSARTDKDGRFVLTGLRYGRIRISVQHLKYSERKFELETGNKPVTLNLGAGS